MNLGPGSQRALEETIKRQNDINARKEAQENARKERIREIRAWLTCIAAVLGVLISLAALIIGR